MQWQPFQLLYYIQAHLKQYNRLASPLAALNKKGIPQPTSPAYTTESRATNTTHNTLGMSFTLSAKSVVGHIAYRVLFYSKSTSNM